MIKKLQIELKYQKELLRMARTPHQRDKSKHKIRLIKQNIGRYYDKQTK